MNRTFAVGLPLVVLAAVSLTSQTAAVSTPHPRSASGAVTIRGCAVRLGPQPYLHTNASHHCTGFRSVRYDHGWLDVESDSSQPVISVAVSPDESLVARGILAGASGGVFETKIRFYSTRSGKIVPAESPDLHCAVCNVWVTITSDAGDNLDPTS
jgi:hypothetical protein